MPPERTNDAWIEAATQLEDARSTFLDAVDGAPPAVRRSLRDLDAAIHPALDALLALVRAVADELGPSPPAAELDRALVADALEWAGAFLAEGRGLAEGIADDDDPAELARELAALARAEREVHLVPAVRAARELPWLSLEPRVGRHLERVARALEQPAPLRRAA